MLDPDTYYPANPDALLRRLVFVTAQLANLHLSLFDARQNERRARDKIINDAGPAASVASSKRDADLGSYTQWVTVNDLEAQVASYTEERDLLTFLVDHAGA